MALFPRFGTEPPAKVAKPAKVGLASPVHAANFRNFRNFRGPGGLEFPQRAEPGDHIGQRVADLAAERMAIALEDRDIGETEARRIAEAEIGRRFVEEFITVAACRFF